MIFLQNHGEGGSSFVQLGSNDIPIEQFLISVRFEHKSKLDQLGIKTGSLEKKMGK